MTGTEKAKRGTGGNRGVALLITLLVTTLLIALIFEFAYATRVSLRSAANFRDSQRAYYLARAGVNAFIRYPQLQEMVPPGEPREVPFISQGDTIVIFKWEDEKGKIRVSRIRDEQLNPTYNWMIQLFTSLEIDQNILRIIDENNMTFQLPTQLHQVMNDEDFAKIESFVTTLPPVTPADTTAYKINVMNARREVLEALGMTDVDRFMADRERSRPNPPSDMSLYFPIATYNNVKNYLVFSSQVYRVTSSATVGGYTKIIEAVITRGSPEPHYWRVL